MALLNLFDPRTGMPLAIIDATGITEMRTGAVTALGAEHLARAEARVLGHIGARGTAYWNVRLLDRPVRLRGNPRPFAPARKPRGLRRAALADLGKPVIVCDDWELAVRGADIMVEASRLERPEPLLKTDWIEPGALVIPYGTMSAVELSLTDIMDKMVVDDWGQCRSGQFGSLRAHVEAGKLTRGRHCTGSSGEIVAGRKPGRERTTRRSCSGTAA